MTRPDDVADSTRERLLDAAAGVFAERGFDGAGVAEIARRAGLTTGAIYSQFTGKAHLLVEAIERSTVNEMAQLLGQKPDEPPTNILAAVGEHLVNREDTDGLMLLLEAYVAARRNPEVQMMLRGRVAQQDAQLREVVGSAKTAGLIDHTLDTEAVISLCHSIALGFVMFRAVGRELPSTEAWSGVVSRLVAAALPTQQEES